MMKIMPPVPAGFTGNCIKHLKNYQRLNMISFGKQKRNKPFPVSEASVTMRCNPKATQHLIFQQNIRNIIQYCKKLAAGHQVGFLQVLFKTKNMWSTSTSSKWKNITWLLSLTYKKHFTKFNTHFWL